MDNNYLEQFKQQCYEPARSAFLDMVGVHLQQHQEPVIAAVLDGLTHFFNNLIQLQKEIPIAVGAIEISLLATSVYFGQPVFRIEAFADSSRMGAVLLTGQLQADWLFPGWEDFKEQLEEGCQQLHLQRYVRAEQIRVLQFETIEYLTFMAAVYLKYVLSYCDRIEGFGRLIQADHLVVSVGQYQDWQTVLYCQEPEVDLFFNPEKQPLTFQKYADKVYVDKIFRGLDLAHVRFSRCRFIRCHFEELSLNDSVFEDCVLQQLTTMQVTMYGISFLGCQFEQADFSGVQFYTSKQTIKEYYQQPEFIACQSDRQLPDLEVG